MEKPQEEKNERKFKSNLLKEKPVKYAPHLK